MSGIFRAYAKRVLALWSLPEGYTSCADLNDAVMKLPPCEFWNILNERQPSKLPHIGEDGVLTALMRQTLFEPLNRDGTFEEASLLIDAEKLERLREWDEWQTLTRYLMSMDLVPFIVFRNTPIKRFKGVVYPADIRVGFQADYMR